MTPPKFTMIVRRSCVMLSKRHFQTTSTLYSKKKKPFKKNEGQAESEIFVIETREQDKKFSILDKISNKRITRLQSDIEIDDEHYNSRLMNRNPINLQYLSYEKKPTGFWLDKDPPMHYNRIEFNQDSRHLIARLNHWSGRTIIEVSTGEPGLTKYFKSPKTTQAATLLAKIFAIRCLRSGYLNAGVSLDDSDENSGPKTKAFFESVESNGILLEEFPEIVPRAVTDL